MVEQVQKFNKIGISAKFVGEAQTDLAAKEKSYMDKYKLF